MNDLQISMVVATATKRKGAPLTQDELEDVLYRNRTRRESRDYLMQYGMRQEEQNA